MFVVLAAVGVCDTRTAGREEAIRCEFGSLESFLTTMVAVGAATDGCTRPPVAVPSGTVCKYASEVRDLTGYWLSLSCPRPFQHTCDRTAGASAAEYGLTSGVALVLACASVWASWELGS